VFSANTVFGTPDTSDGYMARWLPIPFPFSFIGREDPSVETAMHAPAELEGVLVKAVEGLRSLMARGRFTEPQSIAEVRARFERESDPIRAFLEACAKRADDPSAYTFTSELYDVYVAYCEDSGVKPQHRKSRPKFIAAVTACGYPVKDRQGKNAFIGLTTTALVNPQAFGSERLIYTEETLG
jgi:phage/plasmid-associated DNA primase